LGVAEPPTRAMRVARKPKRKKKEGVYGVWSLEVVESALHWLYRRKYYLRLLKI